MKTCPKCGVEYPDTTTLCPADGIALEKTDDSLLGKTLAGKYRIDERLSEGGMGTVYRGTHVLMDKTVAVKVLRPSLAADEKIVARFSREARAASRISHPNALSVTDFGEDEGGIVFLVMEYLSGKTLKQVIREEGPLPLNRVVSIMRQVGDALGAAHEQGVVHRDLKSDNIMLLNIAGGEHAKVLDFGIAKINEPEGEFDGGLTAPNLVIGTPQYMSPEQCSQSTDIDARSDIYSFGVILYEMLVGHVPFSGESSTNVMMKHLQEPVPSVLEERTDIPPAIGRVVTRAMAKLPENRYQNIRELLEDLTIASGMTANVPVVPVTNQVTTPRVSEDPDEVTVVRPRAESYSAPQSQIRVPITVPMVPEIRSTFNPLKVLIPSAAAVLVLFAVIYVFTRNSGNSNANNTNQTQTLAADPNSQPVEPAAPATGKNEQGIPSGGTITPATNVNVNANANVDAAVSPTPVENLNENTATNDNQNANNNANSNRKAPPVPTPTRTIVPEEEPPPTPSGTNAPETKPSPAAPKPSATVPPQ